MRKLTSPPTQTILAINNEEELITASARGPYTNFSWIQFNLHDHVIGPYLVGFISRFLTKNNHITQLTLLLGGNSIDGPSVEALTQSLLQLSAMRILEIELGENYIAEKEAVAFANVIKESTLIQSLRFKCYKSKIGSPGLSKIADAIKNHPSLKEVYFDFSFNQIGYHGARDLFQALQLNVFLATATIDLSFNKIDDGFINLNEQRTDFLRRSLLHFGILRRLRFSLANNQITHIGAIKLATMMKGTSLEFDVDLSGNTLIGLDGIKALASIMMTNTQLIIYPFDTEADNTDMETDELYPGIIPSYEDNIFELQIQILNQRNLLIRNHPNCRKDILAIAKKYSLYSDIDIDAEALDFDDTEHEEETSESNASELIDETLESKLDAFETCCAEFTEQMRLIDISEAEKEIHSLVKAAKAVAAHPDNATLMQSPEASSHTEPYIATIDELIGVTFDPRKMAHFSYPRLYLADTFIGPYISSYILRFISINSHAKKIKLSFQRNVYGICISTIIKAIVENITGLEELIGYVTSTSLANSAFKTMFEHLQKAPQLRSVTLLFQNTEMSAASAGYLAHFIQSNHTVKVMKLALPLNNIGDNGSKAIADALKETDKTVDLDVSDNQITQKGAQVLVDVMLHNPHIMLLDLPIYPEVPGVNYSSLLRGPYPLRPKLHVGGDYSDTNPIESLIELMNWRNSLVREYPDFADVILRVAGKYQLYSGRLFGKGQKGLAQSPKFANALTEFKSACEKFRVKAPVGQASFSESSRKGKRSGDDRSRGSVREQKRLRGGLG